MKRVSEQDFAKIQHFYAEAISAWEYHYSVRIGELRQYDRGFEVLLQNGKTLYLDTYLGRI